MTIDWKKVQDESIEHTEKLLSQAARQGSAERDFYSAGLEARQSIKADGFLPTPTQFGEFRYTIRQGLMASCHTRQDAASILIIQLSLLRRLQSLKNMGWIIIGLLTFIAVRVSL